MHSKREKNEKILIRKDYRRARQIEFHSKLLNPKSVKIEKTVEDKFSRKLKNIQSIAIVEVDALENCFVYDLSES